MRHNKPYGLVYHLENTPVKNLIRKDGFGHHISGKHGTFHFRGDEKPLRVFGEQQQCRIGEFARFRSQVEMGQYLRNIFGHVRDGEIAFSFGQIDKEPYLFWINIVHCGLTVEGRVEWQQTKVFFLLKISDQRSVNRASQLLIVGERLPDHILLGFGNKGFFFRLARIGLFNENQTMAVI